MRLTTTKLPSTLEQPWMGQELLDRMRTATGPVEVMSGTAREVPVKFPKSTNVAARSRWPSATWTLCGSRSSPTRRRTTPAT